MSLYARLTETGSLLDLVDITPEQYAALAGNPKQSRLRLLVTDAQPTPSATQYVAPGPVVIEPTQARRTWVLVAKSAAQIDAETLAAERVTDMVQLALVVTALRDGTGTAGERLTRVERVCVRLLRDALR